MVVGYSTPPVGFGIPLAIFTSVAAVDQLEEVTDSQLTGIDLRWSRSWLEIAVTSPYGHDHGQVI